MVGCCVGVCTGESSLDSFAQECLGVEDVTDVGVGVLDVMGPLVSRSQRTRVALVTLQELARESCSVPWALRVFEVLHSLLPDHRSRESLHLNQAKLALVQTLTRHLVESGAINDAPEDVQLCKYLLNRIKADCSFESIHQAIDQVLNSFSSNDVAAVARGFTAQGADVVMFAKQAVLPLEVFNKSTLSCCIEIHESVPDSVDRKEDSMVPLIPIPENELSESETGSTSIGTPQPSPSKENPTRENALKTNKRKFPALIAESHPVIRPKMIKPERHSMKLESLNTGKRRKWNEQEENWLIEGVQKFGKGNWKTILNAFPFEGRTCGNLKDKFRNLELYGHISIDS